MLRRFGSGMLLVKKTDSLQAFLDDLDGQTIIVHFKGLRAAGTRQNQQKLGLKLAQSPNQLRGIGVLFDEVKHIEVAFRVANHPGVVFQFQQANITVMILQRLKLEFGAILCDQLKTFIAAVIGGQMLVKLCLIMLQQGSISERALPVGPPFGIHLQQAQIHSELNFFLPIFGFKPADDHFPWLIIPLRQKMRYIEIHAPNMYAINMQVNAVAWPSPSALQVVRPETYLAMSSLVEVAIHGSQFPQKVTQDLVQSLRTRQVNHKFHYDSFKQARQWLALHRTYSPSRTQPECAAIYAESFKATIARIDNTFVHVIGLGCGGGQKDTRLLELLEKARKAACYTPLDVSLALVLVAAQSAHSSICASHCFPLVCDLASAENLPEVLENRFNAGQTANSDPTTAKQFPTRLFTFLGMIPNFAPQGILPKLKGLLRPADYLLLSANLAPGPDYAGGINQVLPQYDNELTRQWLLTFLLDLGIEKNDGKLRCTVEADPEANGLKRITIYFDFIVPRSIEVADESFFFVPGDSIRLFFSYRHTPERMKGLLAEHGLEVVDQWICSSEEEGVFLISSHRP